MNDSKMFKKSFCSRHRWLILILILFLITVVILTTILVIQVKRNSQPLIINTSNIFIISEKHNVSYEKYALEKSDNWSFFVIDFNKRFTHN
jgi:uncharacterized membrane protein